MTRAAPLAALALVACSFPEKQLVTPDATEETPFGCLGKPLPSTAPDKVTITGNVNDPYAGIPVGGASIEGYLVGVATPIFAVTADEAGAFSHDQGTGGLPRNAYLKVTANSFLDAYFVPAVPIVRDIINQRVITFSAAELMMLGGVGGVAIDPLKAQLIVSVIDCTGAPVPGATITTSPAGTVRYFANEVPSMDAVATDARTASALIANLPAGNTTVNATIDGMVLRGHNLDLLGGTLTLTEIQP